MVIHGRVTLIIDEPCLSIAERGRFSKLLTISKTAWFLGKDLQIHLSCGLCLSQMFTTIYYCYFILSRSFAMVHVGLQRIYLQVLHNIWICILLFMYLARHSKPHPVLETPQVVLCNRSHHNAKIHSNQYIYIYISLVRFRSKSSWPEQFSLRCQRILEVLALLTTLCCRGFGLQNSCTGQCMLATFHPTDLGGSDTT